MTLTHGELFAGISGFGLGFERAGMMTKWWVEQDPRCQDVLRRHHPGVPGHDDVLTSGTHNLEPVDVISFGSPCQDLSVAGKRKGIHGERSGLFFEAIRIIRELRPAIAVWENVPGALSSAGGADFAAALDALADAGALDIGWTILDAQWFGVAQRRRRLFVVADFRERRAGEILSIPYGRKGDTPPSRQAGTRVAATIESGTNRTGGTRPPGTTVDTADTLIAWDNGHGDPNADGDGTAFALNPQANQGVMVARGLTARQSRLHGDDNFVAATLGAHFPGESNRWAPYNEADNLVAHTFRAEHDASEDGTGRGTPLVFESRYARNGRGAPDTIVPPLKAESGQTGKGDAAPMVFGFTPRRTNHGALDELSPTMNTGNGGFGAPGDAGSTFGVRRLMPVECERLQGFPDGHTDGQTDSPRYRQLGNAVAVPVAEWIGRRIVAALLR